MPCIGILEQLGVEHSASALDSSASILMICRMTAILLDLGLVAYAGSHGSRFDLEYLKKDCQTIEVSGIFDNAFDIRCNLLRLACLDGFLDQRMLWIFQVSTAGKTLASKQKDVKPLSILTRMDDFADIWGPVWAVPAGPSYPDQIKQYNVSKGTICRVSKTQDTSTRNAIRCHWYSWTSFYRRRFSNLLSRSEDLLLSKDDLLLIGGVLRENRSCRYSLGDYEADYGDHMNDLGPKPSTWQLDSRVLSVGFSKLFGITVSGSQKKIPETTVKQHFLEKWTNNPTRANPGVLNHFLGVEISHCTGNARRTSIKDLLLMPTVLPLLQRQIPAWETTTWGFEFLAALRQSNSQSIFDVWNKHRQYRSKMAELVCCVLETLDTTGRGEDSFVAGFLNINNELSVAIDARKNDWTIFLRDSHLTAVYAIVNEACLECQTPNHSTATCNNAHSYTVLQTQMATQTKSMYGRIKLHPYGHTLKKADSGSQDVNLLSLESDFERGLSFATTLNHSLATGIELRDQSRRWGVNADIYIRASIQSHGGMKIPRTRFTGLQETQPSAEVLQQELGMGIPEEPIIVAQQNQLDLLQPELHTHINIGHKKNNVMNDIREYDIDDGTPRQKSPPTHFNTEKTKNDFIDDIHEYDIGNRTNDIDTIANDINNYVIEDDCEDAFGREGDLQQQHNYHRLRRQPNFRRNIR
ncbi:hypothetical protein MMC06_000082 [Schaereria dolodes]|nr:hypothetical protein [Schaereria dolodes]